MSGNYDAMLGGFGKTELSGNDAYAVALTIQLSNFIGSTITRSWGGQMICLPSLQFGISRTLVMNLLSA
jgi:hypothetical protein